MICSTTITKDHAIAGLPADMVFPVRAYATVEADGRVKSGVKVVGGSLTLDQARALAKAINDAIKSAGQLEGVVASLATNRDRGEDAGR